MKVLLSGGGTGGHITPILAVAHELKRLQPDCYIVYVAEREGKFANLAAGNPAIDRVETIFAGKFRRYYSESWWSRLVDIKTHMLNLRDAAYVCLGFWQALAIVRRVDPDVVLLKGGYVGVPVGISAGLLGKVLVTHDSDTVPGLANRLVGRWAAVHATGLPVGYYPYPRAQTRYVGILVSSDYVPVTAELQKSYRRELELPIQGRILLITGGSLGALRLNQAMVQLVPKLLEDYPDLHIIHQVGKGNGGLYGGKSPDRLYVMEFLHSMHMYLGVADVVVTRAGATTLAELGVQGKACIVVPNPLLTGGHQLKNAEYYQAHHAVMVAPETATATDADVLDKCIRTLLDDHAMRIQLAQQLQSITIKDGTHQLAMVLLEAARNHVPTQRETNTTNT